MTDTDNNTNEKSGRATGYHDIDTSAVISVEEVTQQAKKLGEGVSVERVAELAANAPYVSIQNLRAGYGKMEWVSE